MSMITIHTSVFLPWEEWEDEPTLKDSYSEVFDTAEYLDDLGDWSDDAHWNDDLEWVGTWVLATDVYAAAQLLSGHGHHFYASETSASPTDGTNVWYIEETDIDNYTGERREQTAHLSGFTEDEQREIYALVFPHGS
jgi:hypothetical protein